MYADFSLVIDDVKGPLRRLWRGWKDNIRMSAEVTGLECLLDSVKSSPALTRLECVD
jgi:hypothetical protein